MENTTPYLDEPRYFRMSSGAQCIQIVCTRRDELDWYLSEPDLYTEITVKELNEQERLWRIARDKIN